MRKRPIYLALLLLAVVVGVGLFAASAFRKREPEYGGKKLSEWVRELDRFDATRFARGAEALHAIGTNAIPYLLEWISYEPAQTRIKRFQRINLFLRKINRDWRVDDGEWIRTERAALALSLLRPESDACIPELARLANSTNVFYGAKNAIEALSGFGEAGAATLLAALTNGPISWRSFISSRLGSMGTNAQACVPELQRLLIVPDANLRMLATNALRKLDPRTLRSSPP